MPEADPILAPISDSVTRDSRRDWVYGIRTRLFLWFALFAILITVSLSIWLERQARQELEAELTEKLYAVGGSAVTLLKPSLVPGLLSFTPAHRSLRTYRDAQRTLTDLRDRTRVRRVFLADPAGHSYVDTDSLVAIGTQVPKMLSHRSVVSRVLEGRPASAPLFTDLDGQIRKTGYVPVALGEQVVAVVGVEADAAFLGAVRALRNRILGVGMAGVLLALGASALLARGLTRPIERLVGWAERLGSGDLSHAVPVSGKGEIGVLGETLEQMRVHLETQDRELRAMVAGVAHEIRNPLGGMRLYAEILGSDAELGDAQKTRIAKILGELDQLARIVDEFLLFARPANPSPESIPLEPLLGELFEWIRPEADPRGVTLEWTGEKKLEVTFDPTHLRQVLRNLIGNALEASPDGGSVRVTAHSPSHDRIRLDVEDTGSGIDGSVRDRVFEPFFTTKVSGAGLGLPIVQRLSLLNQARIEVGSAEIGGARFTVVMQQGRRT